MNQIVFLDVDRIRAEPLDIGGMPGSESIKTPTAMLPKITVALGATLLWIEDRDLALPKVLLVARYDGVNVHCIGGDELQRIFEIGQRTTGRRLDCDAVQRDDVEPPKHPLDSVHRGPARRAGSPRAAPAP